MVNQRLFTHTEGLGGPERSVQIGAFTLQPSCYTTFFSGKTSHGTKTLYKESLICMGFSTFTATTRGWMPLLFDLMTLSESKKKKKNPKLLLLPCVFKSPKVDLKTAESWKFYFCNLFKGRKWSQLSRLKYTLESDCWELPNTAKMSSQRGSSRKWGMSPISDPTFLFVFPSPTWSPACK